MALNVEKNDFSVRMASRRSTRAFRVALATGKAEDPDVEIPVPDGDFPVRKRYPDEV